MTDADHVPLIDLGRTRAGATAADRRETAALIGHACRNTGFFAVEGHGVPDHVVDRMYRATRATFALPENDKRGLISDPADPLRRGLTRAAAVALSNDPSSRLAGRDRGDQVQTPPRPDLCETYSICVAAERDTTAPDPIVHQPNRWPEDTEIRLAWLDYAVHLSALATDLMRLFARALGLSPSWFDDKIGNDISSMTANRYPAQPQPPQPGQIRKGEHTDWGSLTLLYQDAAAGGLQTLGPNGDWRDVPAIAGTFVVNLGDLMGRWTNDAWVSTAHRVVNPPREFADTERYSIAYFHQPDFDAAITCIPTCRTPGEPARYETVTSGAYLLDKVARTHAVTTMRT